MSFNIQLQNCGQLSIPPATFRHIVWWNDKHQQLQKTHEDYQDKTVAYRAVSEHQRHYLYKGSKDAMIDSPLPVLRWLTIY